MNVHHYETNGGKDLILEFIKGLPQNEKAKASAILKKLKEDGLLALDVLTTRQLKSKLWEIKFYDENRFMYVILDEDNIYLLHACKKQKNKTEKFELNTAINRVKELEILLGKKFI